MEVNRASLKTGRKRRCLCTLCRGRTAGVPSCSQSHAIYRFRVSVRQVLAALVLPTASYIWIDQATGRPDYLLQTTVRLVIVTSSNGHKSNMAGGSTNRIESRRNARFGIQCLDYHHHWHMRSEWEAGIPTARSTVDVSIFFLFF
jgi:hypothetical protein